MRFPTTDRYVSSAFGWRTHPVTGIRTLHAGADFPLPGMGAGVLAVNDWSFHAKGFSYSGGNWVAIRLADGVLAYYYHMKDPTHLVAGQRGAQGELVGRMGMTGAMVTGPHLHFETRRADGTPFDPIPYLEQGSPAGGGGQPFPTPDPDASVAARRRRTLMVMFWTIASDGKPVWALAGASPGVAGANWIETRSQDTANEWAQQTGGSCKLELAGFNKLRASFQGPVVTV